jgi:hypothetical protein
LIAFSPFLIFGATLVKETAPTLVRGDDVTELLERARRARDEAQRLSSDYRFIVSWYVMRPRFAVPPSSKLDRED